MLRIVRCRSQSWAHFWAAFSCRALSLASFFCCFSSSFAAAVAALSAAVFPLPRPLHSIPKGSSLAMHGTEPEQAMLPALQPCGALSEQSICFRTSARILCKALSQHDL